MLQKRNADQSAGCRADHFDIQCFLVERPCKLEVEFIPQVHIFGQRVVAVSGGNKFIALDKTHAQHVYVICWNGFLLGGGRRQRDHPDQQGQAQNDR